MAESLAIERANKLFGAPWANVQAHSGSQANQAVYTAALKPGDTILGMSLAHGGHLTHGSPVNLSGKLYRVVSYALNEKEEIDYQGAEKTALLEKPKLIVTGASAYSLAIDWKRFRDIADRCGALLMADIAHYAGLIATGLYPSPLGIADFVTTTTHKTLRGPRGGMIFGRPEQEKAIASSIFPGLQGGPLMHVIAAKAVALGEALKPEFTTYQKNVLENARTMATVLAERGLRIVSGRTDCHMFLVDLRSKGITGKDAEAALGRAHITVNKNAIPNDPQKPAVTSGVRIGSPAMTTRGFGRREAEKLAHLIADVLERPADEASLARVAHEVKALCARFPVYA
jgi:glycine hydroxymethyltransferase